MTAERKGLRVSDSVLDAYLEEIDPRFAPAVTALHRAVTEACPELGVKISYKMLLYALDGDFRHWVTGISATSKAAQLRFLFGYLMKDERGLFRGAKDSPLRTIDFVTPDKIDTQMVAEYVAEAAGLREYYIEHEDERPTSRPH